ncbi:Ras-related protein Rab-5A [Tritrichomonas foetus]|uniref:Ras-related protein Rab-5A n=1 Tax=Tritrichomonas foetus TaxID=1144522 RepID=A0A1J4JUF7_9EUKA|nr:Ras-related protein Rab-5A [Tritrichomonas foetus]|eukprot:OHT02777.1 Ras-related protein Rab-5A [Tritrichomonas foetus]
MDAFRADKAVKLVMLGDSSVGKTSIVMQFYRNVFHEECESTVGGNYITKTITTQNGPVTLNVWDTAGQERFRGIVPMYTRGSQAAIIVFSLQDESSFQSVEQWIDLIQKTESYRCKIYIAANKIDLGQTHLLNEAKTWASKNKLPLFTTSAKDQASVINLFQNIAQDIGDLSGTFQKTTSLIPPSKNDKKPNCC